MQLHQGKCRLDIVRRAFADGDRALGTGSSGQEWSWPQRA